MIDISVSEVYKAFDPERPVLGGLSFDVYEGEKVGLLGKNGAGKTTLFKILEGSLPLDSGSVAIPRQKRLGILSQIPVYPEAYTVEDVLYCAFERIFSLREQMRSLEKLMQEGAGGGALSRYGEVSSAFEAAGGYEYETRAARVSNGLSIPEKMRKQPFISLSGGEQTRVNLARLILMDTDILLLDEPTNHLDLSSAEWLEDFLQKYRGTALVVSHDRYFLDHAVSRIIEIENGRAVFYDGNYSFYVSEKENRYIQSLSRYEQEQKKIEQLKETALRMHTWAQGHDNPALHKRAFAMERRIERLKATDKPVKERALTAYFKESEFKADDVLRANGLSKSYGGRKLFSRLDLDIRNGERIALIGDNGSGKTTLLNIINGETAPDEGRLRLGPSVKAAYMRQIVTFENTERSLLDTLIYELDCSAQTARNRLGAFHFYGDEVFKQVSDLSGGERSRLMLCLLMAQEVNFLMLDEPTNHMDVGSREWIEEVVSSFSGTLLFVSHDRYFINRFASRILEFENGQVYDFKGGYEQYRHYRQREQKAKELSSASAPKIKKAKAAASVGIANRAKIIEAEISKLEERLKSLDDQMAENACDYDKLSSLYKEKTVLEEEIEALYNEWNETY